MVYLLAVSTHGQVTKQMDIPRYKNGDTTRWYTWQYKIDSTLYLSRLTLSTDTFHFRFWGYGQTVDVWTANHKTFYGLLTNHIQSYEPYDEKKNIRKPSTTFSCQVELDTALARQTYGLIQTILDIPTDQAVSGWQFGTDGVTYLFETATPISYSFKSYWTPTAQDSTLMEAKKIQAFVDSIGFILNLEAEYDTFFDMLKPGSYTVDHYMIQTKLTDKQARLWKKHEPHRQYLDSINDTLNSYLSDTLTKIFRTTGDSISYHRFWLKFSPKNKLLKIFTREEFSDSWDRRDAYRRRRKIKSAFRKIRIDFVHAKANYYRQLSYWDKRFIISQ